MMRAFAYISFAALLSGAAFGQSTSTKPAFQIADVHVSPHASNPIMQGGVLRAGRYELRQATMLDLIKTAYGVDPETVVGGPGWLESDRFDVIAKASPATSAGSDQSDASGTADGPFQAGGPQGYETQAQVCANSGQG